MTVEQDNKVRKVAFKLQ